MSEQIKTNQIKSNKIKTKSKQLKYIVIVLLQLFF